MATVGADLRAEVASLRTEQDGTRADPRSETAAMRAAVIARMDGLHEDLTRQARRMDAEPRRLRGGGET